LDRDLIAEIVAKTFPRGAELTWSAGDVHADDRFFVIPDNLGPRWIIPCDPSRGWPFLKQWRPYKVSSRLKWRMLMVAYARGQLGRLPQVIPLGISGYKDQAWDHVGWSAPEPPVPVIYVGTPHRARKAVVGLMDTDECYVSAIAKIPLGAEARRTIAHEVDVLARLEKEKPGLAPRSLFVNKKTGVSVQEAIEGKPTTRRLTQAHITWLLDLAIPAETISLREEAERLAQQVVGHNDIDHRTRHVLNLVLSEIDDCYRLPATWVHGDFAPWNLKRTPSRTLRAIDWEYASPRGLPLFDLIYYRSIQAFLFKEKKLFPRSIQPLLGRYMEYFGIGSSMFRKIMLACLAKQWLRRHREGSRQHASFLFQQLSE